jgi:hypothetical protein
LAWGVGDYEVEVLHCQVSTGDLAQVGEEDAGHVIDHVMSDQVLEQVLVYRNVMDDGVLRVGADHVMGDQVLGVGGWQQLSLCDLSSLVTTHEEKGTSSRVNLHQEGISSSAKQRREGTSLGILGAVEVEEGHH